MEYAPPPLLQEFGDRKTIHKIRKRFQQKRTAEDIVANIGVYWIDTGSVCTLMKGTYCRQQMRLFLGVLFSSKK